MRVLFSAESNQIFNNFLKNRPEYNEFLINEIRWVADSILRKKQPGLLLKR